MEYTEIISKLINQTSFSHISNLKGYFTLKHLDKMSILIDILVYGNN